MALSWRMAQYRFLVANMKVMGPTETSTRIVMCIFGILPVDLVFVLQHVMDNHGHQCIM
jgi:hypothetical protein